MKHNPHSSTLALAHPRKQPTARLSEDEGRHIAACRCGLWISFDFEPAFLAYADRHDGPIREAEWRT